MTTTQEGPVEQDQTIYDVVISGGGPVGLFLACELALAECSVLILEKSAELNSPLKRIPFGIRGLSAPSIEALYRRDLLKYLELHKRLKNPHQNSGQGANRQVGHFAGIPFLEGNVDVSQWKYRLPGSPKASLMTEMEEIEKALNTRALSLGVKILCGLSVTDFHQTEDDVTINSGGCVYKAKWLVGCDGSRSVVRKIGGFEFAGTEPEFTGYSTQIEIADPEKLKAGRNVTPMGMYMQSQPGYVTIQDFDGGAFHGSQMPITRDHVQQVLRKVSNTDVTVTALHLATTWTDRARQATHYRNGRVLLAGDAAHIHSPLGGQGLNLGLGDAMNLGWKLAAVIQGNAPEGLIDSYEAERHPLGIQVLDWSRAQVAIMNTDPNARALNSIVRDLINTKDGATYFAGRVWGVNMRYDLGGAHPLTGRSVPNFEFNDGRKIGELMHDGRALLLDFDSNASIQSVVKEYGSQINYITGEVVDRLSASAMLIRPDGIIAWATDDGAEHNDLPEVLGKWFMPDVIDETSRSL